MTTGSRPRAQVWLHCWTPQILCRASVGYMRNSQDRFRDSILRSKGTSCREAPSAWPWSRPRRQDSFSGLPRSSADPSRCVKSWEASGWLPQGAGSLWSTALQQRTERPLGKAIGRAEEPAPSALWPVSLLRSAEQIFQKVLESGRTDTKRSDKILAGEAGLRQVPDEDLFAAHLQLESQLNRAFNGRRAMRVLHSFPGRS